MPGGSMVPRYVLQLLFSENHKIDKNSATTKAREKMSTDLESFVLEILLNKACHRYLLTTKLFTG
jgi:hypothetical protein